MKSRILKKVEALEIGKAMGEAIEVKVGLWGVDRLLRNLESFGYSVIDRNGDRLHP